MKILNKLGEQEDFKKSEVYGSIEKAFRASGNAVVDEVIEDLTEQVSVKLHAIKTIPVDHEVVASIVEEVLRVTDNHDVFAQYRSQQQLKNSLQTTAGLKTIFNKYLDKSSWEINENANMGYSLQGLNHAIVRSAIERQWLDKIYPEKIAAAYRDGYMHIHDLDSLSTYCCGWDIQDLLLQGFGGVSGKVVSGPPKHFGTALGQLVNFLYTLQGEIAGAVAVSNLDTYLAPFISKDGLTYKEVKQALQEFVYNMNVPTRVGFQCLSEDTEILTDLGWKSIDDVVVGTNIATYNMQARNIEYLFAESVFTRAYDGDMYHITGRGTDQLVSPRHRILRRGFNSDTDLLEEVELAAKLRTPLRMVSGSCGMLGPDILSDDLIQLSAWIIAEGSSDKNGRGVGRISIYQSPKKYLVEIEELLGRLGVSYTKRMQEGLGDPVAVLRLGTDANKLIYELLQTNKERGVKVMPTWTRLLNARQANMFIETYMKADGCRRRISTISSEIKDGIVTIAVLAGLSTSVALRKRAGVGISKHNIWLISILDGPIVSGTIRKAQYRGRIWCPTTKNQTVVARRNGKVFITGNSPFSNVTLDLTVPKHMKDLSVIIGGEAQKESYGEFQKEMDMFNKAFFEVMAAGDYQGRIFTFPIPTINITKNFDWDNPAHHTMWDTTAKFGTPYFANYINSDMDPSESRSMCPLDGSERILHKSSRGWGLEVTSLKGLHDYFGNSEFEIFADGKFVTGKLARYDKQKMMTVELVNGHKLTMSTTHANLVKSSSEDLMETVPGESLRVGNYLPYSLNAFPGSGGTYELGYFVGAYAGDGSLDSNTSVIFSLHKDQKLEVASRLIKIAKDQWGAQITETITNKLLTVRVCSKAAVGLCTEFVESMKRTKQYAPNMFQMSLEFRRGVWDGHYATDGGNRNRIYTSSPRMVESLNMLAASMGTATSVIKDSRAGRLGVEPNYSVLTYQLNRESYGDTWFKSEGKLWVRIKRITKIAARRSAYCFEVLDGDAPVFTVGGTGILTHNCRLRLSLREIHKRHGGLFGSGALTGSLGVVTLSLPMMAHESKGSKAKFYTKIEKYTELARDALEIKRGVIEALTTQGLYPYSKHYLSKAFERDKKYWSNHFSTVGLIGMYEAATMLGVDYASAEGKKFAETVLKFMNRKLVTFQNETGNFYNLEATPAEGASYKLALAAKKKYPDIKTSGTHVPYFTNSTMLPVNSGADLFKVLEHQDSIQSLYSGGCVEGGTLVVTDRGEFPIEYIVKNYESMKPLRIISYNVHNRISEWDEVMDAVQINVAVKDKIRVIGERGLDITTSDWHPFLVLKNKQYPGYCPNCQKVMDVKSFATHLRFHKECREVYKHYSAQTEIIERRADELTKGDHILQNSSVMLSKKDAMYTEDDMYILGFFIGDGALSARRDNRGGNNLLRHVTRFFSGRTEPLYKLRALLAAKFGSVVNLQHTDKRSPNLAILASNTKSVADFLLEAGFVPGEKTYTVRFSSAIKSELTQKNAWGLLAGLVDSDGHIGKHTGTFEYYTVSKDLIDDMSYLLTLLGVVHSKKPKLTRRANEVDGWRIIIPNYEFLRILPHIPMTTQIPVRTRPNTKYSRYIPAVVVTSVSKVNVKDNMFYDLTARRNHNYLAGNATKVFIHNTVLHAYLGEQITGDQAKLLVKKVMTHYSLPYLSITSTFSICPRHGYIPGEHPLCPKCIAEKQALEDALKKLKGDSK